MAFARGDIYRVNLEPALGSEQQGNARPCVILSVTNFNRKFPTIGVVPLSSARVPHPPLVPGVPSAGRDNSVAICNQLRLISKGRIVGQRIGVMTPADLEKVEAGVKQYYGL